MAARSTEWQPNKRIHLWENFERCLPLGAEIVEASERCHSIDSESGIEFMQIKRTHKFNKASIESPFSCNKLLSDLIRTRGRPFDFFFCLINFHIFFLVDVVYSTAKIMRFAHRMAVINKARADGGSVDRLSHISVNRHIGVNRLTTKCLRKTKKKM